MRRILFFVPFLLIGLIAVSVQGVPGDKSDDSSWTRQFAVADGELTSTGRNPFFVLEPGYQLVLEDAEDDEGEDRVAGEDVPVHHVAAEGAAHGLEDEKREQHPVEKADRQVPDLDLDIGLLHALRVANRLGPMLFHFPFS